MVRIFLIFTFFVSTQVFAQYSDSLYKQKRIELKRHARHFDGYYNNLETHEKAIFYMKLLENNLENILHYPQSHNDKFTDITILDVRKTAGGKFRLISFGDNPGGNHKTETNYIQWFGNDSILHVQELNQLGISGSEVDISILNDSLFLCNFGILQTEVWSQFVCLLKLKNDTFKIVYNAWSHNYFNKHFPCELYRVDSWGIVCDKYVELYNPKTRKIILDEGCFGKGSCADKDCETYRILYYQFIKDHFVLRQHIVKTL